MTDEFTKFRGERIASNEQAASELVTLIKEYLNEKVFTDDDDVEARMKERFFPAQDSSEATRNQASEKEFTENFTVGIFNNDADVVPHTYELRFGMNTISGERYFKSFKEIS